MFKTRKGLLAIILILLFTGGLKLPDLKNFGIGKDDPRQIVITDDRREHILYGDERGGGHKHGLGKPCKSEFPENWGDDEIISRVQTLAANDNLSWKPQKNGYYTAEETVDGIKIRVVLDREKDNVVTAYPVNTKRNACPPRSAANDNFND